LQVLDISDQDVQVGMPYGSEHWEILNSVINPSKPLAHDKALVSVVDIQVGGSATQLFDASIQSDQLPALQV
jgi:hypothetical protein